jgi:hypothetical protein
MRLDEKGNIPRSIGSNLGVSAQLLQFPTFLIQVYSYS